jgi:hypothetical protein
MILQIVTALAIGAYVVLSRDAQPKRADAAHRRAVSAPRQIISIAMAATSSRSADVLEAWLNE